MAAGLQTVTAFGVLADVATGYPLLLSEMTLLTALRTAATSAMVAKHLAPKGATTMAMIGNGAFGTVVFVSPPPRRRSAAAPRRSTGVATSSLCLCTTAPSACSSSPRPNSK
jgi:hypothetical protein